MVVSQQEMSTAFLLLKNKMRNNQMSKTINPFHQQEQKQAKQPVTWQMNEREASSLMDMLNQSPTISTERRAL